MHRPTCIFCANLTPFSLQLEAKAGEELPPTPDAGAAAVEGGDAEAKPSLIPADVGAAKGAEEEAGARP